MDYIKIYIFKEKCCLGSQQKYVDDCQKSIENCTKKRKYAFSRVIGLLRGEKKRGMWRKMSIFV